MAAFQTKEPPPKVMETIRNGTTHEIAGIRVAMAIFRLLYIEYAFLNHLLPL